jgi:hypothetical protein
MAHDRSQAPSSPVALLRRGVIAIEIGELTEQLEPAGQSSRHLAQNNLVASAEDLDLVSGEAELFRQLDRLMVARPENLGCGYPRLCMYPSVYASTRLVDSCPTLSKLSHSFLG